MKTYNEKKICFIICTNDDRKLQECLLYIELLTIPDGYEIEVITIKDAGSMAKGYNEAMNSSDARYKVYLHQDVFITETSFMEKIIHIFKQDKNIGLIGMVGARKLSKDGILYHEERCGAVRGINENNRGMEILEIKEGVQEVEAVEGFLMIACQDIPWREDVFDGWEFGDTSWCLEFARAGYKIVVPAQQIPWTIHDCAPRSFKREEGFRQKLLNTYADVFDKKTKLRVLFFHSTKIRLIGLPMGFMELGHTVVTPSYEVVLESYKKEDEEYVRECLQEGNYDLVVTYDFSRGIARACEAEKVKYLAWVYDSPLMELYTKEVYCEYNYVSVFDRKQKERLQELHIKNLYYCPLAAEVDNFGAVVIEETDEKMYTSEVSFVGMLYDQGWYEKMMESASDEVKADAMKVAQSTNCIWDGKHNLFGMARKETIDHMSAVGGKGTWKEYRIDQRYFNEALLLTRKANEIERVTVLNKLAEKHQVVLYTGSKSTDALKNVEIHPRVDYMLTMPKIFHLSKINLNITSRSIESALPQRIWDVMSVGGFMLTNYQPEIEEYFEIGTDLEVFHNLEELVDKTDYYLKHEKQRLRIAMNGYKKVRQYHKYSNRISQILTEFLGYKE